MTGSVIFGANFSDWARQPDSPVSRLASLLSLAHICLGLDTSRRVFSRANIPARIKITVGLACTSLTQVIFLFKKRKNLQTGMFSLKVVCVSRLELTSGNSCAGSALLWHVEARYGCQSGWLTVSQIRNFHRFGMQVHRHAHEKRAKLSRSDKMSNRSKEDQAVTNNNNRRSRSNNTKDVLNCESPTTVPQLHDHLPVCGRKQLNLN